jgi:carboxyl-terminal processing protease
MDKSRLGFLILSLACLAPFLTGALTLADAEDEDSLFKSLSVFTEVLGLVQRVYVEETSLDALLEGALDGAADALDPLATFVPPGGVDEFSRAVRIGSSRSGVTLAKERGIAFVATVGDGSPAAEAGLEAGDVLTEIDGLSSRRTPLWRLRGILAGEPGERVRLQVLRQAQPEEVVLALAEYPQPLPTLDAGFEVPVLRVSRFDDPSLAEVRRLLGELASAAAPRLVLDLRGAPPVEGGGGYRLAELFVEGEMGRLASRSHALETFTADGAPIWKGELVVLVDRGTLGPAEVAAAVLQQLAGARLVGEPTFGHSGRQSLVDLDGGGRLLLTDAFYTGPDGEPLDTRLDPDVMVRETSRRFGERDVPLSELILRRGIDVLVGEDDESLQDVA